jgi:MtrB/PioB family decaheme-associated outer membrane protein
MNMKNDNSVFGRSIIAAAVALAFPAGSALADEVQTLISPNTSEVSLRLQDLNKVNPLYRMYSGLDSSGVNGSLDVNLVKRSEDGAWMKLQARDLGLPGIQEFGASYDKQGDWKVGLNYNEITKYAPYTINTKVAGVGTDKLTLNPDWRSSAGLGPESSLKLERTGTSLSGSKLFSDAFKLNFSLKSEDKKGAIMSSSYGSTWNGANSATPTKNYGTMFFAPQPENYRHNQVEASIDYFTKALQLSAGYYGSFFNNASRGLNITPGNNALPTLPCNAATCVTAIPAGASALPWISLPPDNRAQQWYVSGAYNFSNSTRLSFKMSKERVTQDDGFIPAYGAVTPLSGTPVSATYNSMNPPGVPYAAGITNTNLGGVVDTTTYFGMLTTKLTKDLDLLASWRYEDRQDKTPQRNYLDAQASTEFPTGAANEQDSHKINVGKFELSYRLPEGYRLTGGLDFDQKKTPDTMRDEVTDKTIRAELRKSLSETLNGKVMLAHSNRTGGAWELLDPTSFPTATNVAAPLQFADRKRDKAKVMVDWNPIDPLSLQLFYEHTKDNYPFTPVGGNARMGMTDGKTDLYGLDAAYKISDAWKVNGYYTYNQNKTHQNELYTPRVLPQTCAIVPASVANTCVPWQADLDMKGEVFGAGVQGKLASWDIGAQYLYSKDKTRYDIAFNPSYPTAATSSVPSGAGVLPDTVYSLNRLTFYGTYKYSKETRLRLDYINDVRKMDDYTWSNWTFSDGTRVNVAPNQKTQMVGLTLIQSF